MTRPCVKCRQVFEPARSHHRACWRCWRDQRDREMRHDAWNEGFHAGRATSPRGVLPAELLRDAVKLCHPDRHPPERAALANKVTAALLALIKSEAA